MTKVMNHHEEQTATIVRQLSITCFSKDCLMNQNPELYFR